MGKIYHVEFPGLNLKFNISPIAFKICNIPVYYYGILISTGFLLAFLYVIKNSKRFNLEQDSLIDVIITGTLTAIAGARLYYVAFYTADTFIKNPIKILFINEGGLAIYGGLIGAIIGGFVVSKIKHLNFLAILDLASLGFLIGQAIGRWGNFTNQEAFGTVTSSILRMVSENTSMQPVHPCFLYESTWCLIGFILIHAFSLKLRKYDGQVFLLYTLWYGTGRFFIESLRTDSLFIPNSPFKISQLIAAIAAIFSVSLLIYNYFKPKILHFRGDTF